ncbi:MAG TPA: phosphatidate cytidylyltransferase [Microvirga sp.]|nr:phosphatidate cytidylyltransferase [Microvirga sp.]
MGDTSSAPPPRWLATELGTRWVSALVLGLTTLFVTYLGGWPFALLWLAAAVAVLIEWVSTTRVENRKPVRAVLGAGLAALTFLTLAGASPVVLALAAAAALAVMAVLARSNRDRLWAAGGFAYAAVIALVPSIVRDHPALGLTGVLWMFAVTWATDVAAYFTGRRLGGPKLWPQVSPKKTWSGFFGGLVGAVACGLAVVAGATSLGWQPPAGLTAVALASALASVLSQLGDLAESALKRSFDVKDSGFLIPGHGGVMDRLDGFWCVCGLVGLALIVM